MRKFLTKERQAPFLLGILLLISAVFIYHRFVFGDELWVFIDPDIGSDTFQQYLPHYHTVVNHIREGTFTFWDFNHGFGTNVFNLNLFDPTLILIYALGVVFGPEHIAWYLVYMQVLRIVLAGLVFYYYLSCFSFSERTKCLIAYIYALNGFQMVWGQHYQFGMSVIYLPLLLLVTERCMRRQRFHPPVVLAVWITTIYSAYRSYMMFVCLGFYIFIRLFAMQKQPLKKNFRMLGILYGSMLLGIGMGAFTLLPTAYVFSGMSGRVVDRQYGLVEWLGRSFLPYERLHYKTLFYKLFSSYLEGLSKLENPKVLYTGLLNYYEDPNVFCSTLFLILGCQYVCCIPRLFASKKQKILHYGLLGVLGFCLMFPFCGLAMNGFTDTSNRHMFVMIPFFCLIMAKMLNDLERKRIFSYLGFGAALLLILFVFVRKYPAIVFLSHKRNLLILSITGILMAAALLCLAKCQKQNFQKIIGALLFGFVIVNMVSEGYTSTLERLTLRKNNTEYFEALYNQDTQDALAWLREHDPEFYRVEKDFDAGSVCLDSLVQNYRGTSTYNSTMNQNIKRFTAILYPDFWYNDLAHYRFRMIEKGQPFADLCGVRYLLSRNGDKDDPYDKSGYRPIQKFGEIQIYENKNATSLGRFYADTVTYSEFKEYLQENGISKARDYILDHLVVEDLPKSLELTHSSEKASAKAVVIEAPVKDTNLKGTVDAPCDGYVMFAIPFEKGWDVYVDGERQELVKANLGFFGISVEKGLHQIELRYHAPGFSQGLAVSLLCWIVFVFLLGFFSKKSKMNSER